MAVKNVIIPLKRYFKTESASGVVLLGMALLSMVVCNSPWADEYAILMHTPIRHGFQPLVPELSLVHWVNDGLMALFFLHVGLEIKSELIAGNLSNVRQAMLPVVAASGGVILPALLFLYFNGNDPVAAQGWAIASATDIAFSLGILSLFGSRVPLALKVLLLAIAVIDDLAAIIIIALFYTKEIHVNSLTIGVIACGALMVLNRSNVQKILPYLLGGIILWLAIFHSGIHASIAGVALAFTIPFKASRDSLFCRIERSIHPYVAFGIMPLFAFANAGIPIQDLSLNSLFEPIPLGIMAGLFLGKQIGIFSFIYGCVYFRFSPQPKDVTWPQIYAMSIIAGIGFTMSLFIGMLAYKSADLHTLTRLGVLAGSALSAITGYLVMQWALPRKL